MKYNNDRKDLVEFLKEININKKTIVALEVFLKEHKISYKDYLTELKEHRPEELTNGNLMDIAISFYEGNLFEKEEQKLSVIIYERELMIREKYKSATDSETKKLIQEELEENKKWYTKELQKLKEKYHKNR